MPPFEHQGVRYQIIRGSDVNRDGMYLELNDVTTGTEELLIEAFYSDAGAGFSIRFFRDSLPFEIVERFVQEARRLLPPISHTASDATA